MLSKNSKTTLSFASFQRMNGDVASFTALLVLLLFNTIKTMEDKGLEALSFASFQLLITLNFD